MNETRWINLSQDQIAPSSHPTDAAWALESPSIYDIPSHVRALYDTATGFVRIEFKYLEPEQTELFTLSEYLRANIGKRSHRIWAIEFDIHNYNRDQKRITQAAEDSIGKISSAKQESRAIASRVIHLNGTNLFSAKSLCFQESRART